MNTSRKGGRSERKTRERLYKLGYDYVQKAGGSLGLFDLIALGQDKNHLLLVQVKSNDLPSPKERDKIADFRLKLPCRKQLWIWIDRKKDPRILDYIPDNNSWFEWNTGYETFKLAMLTPHQYITTVEANPSNSPSL